MQKEYLSFYSEAAGSPIAYYLYLPDHSPRGIVQITHGMCEHIRRYEEFALFLCENGYAVCGHDHPGHGASVSSPDKLGYFAAAGGALLLSQTLRQVTQLAREHFPSLPLVLLGHSMGSYVARDYIARYPTAADALILLGTGGDNPGTLAGIGLADLIMAAKGRFYRSQVLSNLVFGHFNSRFPHPDTSFDWLSRDHTEVEKYQKDPLCGFCFTAAGFRDLFELVHHVNRTAWLMMTPKKLPILMMSGSMDPVGGYGAEVTRVYRRLVSAGCERVSLKLYPQARHELLHETNRREVFDDLLQWIDQACLGGNAL